MITDQGLNVSRKPRLSAGVRTWGVLLAALALLMGLAGPASAESQTVAGTGPTKKMFASNGASAVVAKVYGPGRKCDVVASVAIYMSDRDGTTYRAIGACHPGAPVIWGKSLERVDTGNGVSCTGFKLGYDRTGDFWRFEVPRSCLARLASVIRVRSEMSTRTSAMPGLAGPTRWLARG